jgi:uncharacterized protein YjiS (DUF1127 family)
MSNSEVFGSPMILSGKRALSPFGAASTSSERPGAWAQAGRFLARLFRRILARDGSKRRIRKTAWELSRLDNRTLRDIGLDRSAIISAAQEAEHRRSGRFRRYRL